MKIKRKWVLKRIVYIDTDDGYKIHFASTMHSTRWRAKTLTDRHIENAKEWAFEDEDREQFGNWKRPKTMAYRGGPVHTFECWRKDRKRCIRLEIYRRTTDDPGICKRL